MGDLNNLNLGNNAPVTNTTQTPQPTQLTGSNLYDYKGPTIPGSAPQYQYQTPGVMGYQPYGYQYGQMGTSMPQHPQMMTTNPPYMAGYNPQQYMANNPQTGLNYGIGVNQPNTSSVPITGANLYSNLHTK
jgi:hypothetical protein